MKSRNIHTIVFNLPDGLGQYEAGDRLCILMEGSVASINESELTMRVARVTPTEKEARMSRADIDLENMTPKKGGWGIKKIVEAIAKTPADHSMDRIIEK